jgi:hypothetical protein
MAKEKYKKLTDAQKKDLGTGTSGIFPPTNGFYFDDDAQSINSRYNRGHEGGLQNTDEYNNLWRGSGVALSDIPLVNDIGYYPNIDEDLVIHTWNVRNERSGVINTRYQPFGNLLAPSGGLNIFHKYTQATVSGTYLLSNSFEHKPTSFKLVNKYVHHTHYDDLSYTFQPTSGTYITSKYYRFGKPKSWY